MNNKIEVTDLELYRICKGIANIQKLKEEDKISYEKAWNVLRTVIKNAENVLEILFNKK